MLLPIRSTADPTWMNSLPHGWNTRRLNRSVNLVNERTQGEALPYVGLEHVESWTGRLVNWPGEDQPSGSVSRFVRGDILFGKLRPYLAKVVLATEVGRCSPELLVLRPRVHDSRYLQYQLLSDEFIRRVDATTYGSKMPRANWEDIGTFFIPIPPIQDQRAIADFLDQKTAAIDALIKKKERLIELAEEKRQATITRIVTKGLGPGTRMKDSEVEWLGEVPAHWEVVQTRFVARLESGHTPSRQHPEYWVGEECTIPWFTLADVWQIRGDRQEYLGDTAEKVSPLGLANSSARLLPTETVVLSRTASVGFSGIMSKPMATSQDFVNWVCGPRIRPEYLLFVFRSMRAEFRRLKMGSTHQTIYMPDVRGFRTPLPPIEEQDAILAEVRRETSRFDGLGVKLERQIGRLREYRQALISAAVTGQLDIRARESAELPA
jgi:type I restriction enzyme S subunit